MICVEKWALPRRFEWLLELVAEKAPVTRPWHRLPLVLRVGKTAELVIYGPLALLCLLQINKILAKFEEHRVFMIEKSKTSEL